MDIAITKALLRFKEGERLRVFEWGSGSSTIYFAKYLLESGLPFAWSAVDNSLAWHKKVEEKLERAKLDSHVHTFCSEFPAFWELPGYSVEDPLPPKSITTCDAVNEYVNWPKRWNETFDLIFIDGRFRRRCLLIAKEVLAPGGIVVLHDALRNHYHPSLHEYPHALLVETGNLPGRKKTSGLALCTFEEQPWIKRLVNEHGAREVVVQ